MPLDICSPLTELKLSHGEYGTAFVLLKPAMAIKMLPSPSSKGRLKSAGGHIRINKAETEALNRFYGDCRVLAHLTPYTGENGVKVPIGSSGYGKCAVPEPSDVGPA